MDAADDHARPPPGTVPYNRDDPAAVDELGRRQVARVLWHLLREIRLPARPDPATASAFMLHLHGPWGAGKTTLLTFLRDEIREGEDPGRRWIWVDFNAWQQQRVGSPWWALMNEVQRQGIDELKRTGRRREAARVWLMDRLWRLRSRWGPVLLAGLVLLVFGVVVFLVWPFLPTPLPGGAHDWELPIRIAIGSFTAVGLLLTGTKFLVLGSARQAEAFLEGTHDPTRSVREHYKDLIAGFDRPIAVAIDDLDRCDGRYVVDLLQAIQTLYREAPVVYVVAADRHWITSSYQQAYEPFAARINEVGRPLGYLFLDKIFQLSVSVPRLTPELHDTYWRALIAGAASPGEGKDEARHAAERGRLAGLSEEQVTARIAEVEGAAREASEVRAVREAALERLAEPDQLRATEHFLAAFAHLTDPNPRSMKRLLNAYRYLRDVRLLALGSQWAGGGRDDGRRAPTREQLVLWTIAELRWPLLAEFLADNPDLVPHVGEPAPPEGVEVPDEVRAALRSRAARDVFRGEGLPSPGARLDEGTVRRLSGRGPGVADPGVATPPHPPPPKAEGGSPPQ